MGVFQRIGDIVAANLNDLIERCEDPEKLLRQAVREMEDAVDASLDGAAKALASERLLERELSGRRAEAKERERLAGLALRKNDLERTRRELRRKLDEEKAAESLEKELAAARAAGQALRRQVEDLRAKLDEVDALAELEAAPAVPAEAACEVEAQARLEEELAALRARLGG